MENTRAEETPDFSKIVLSPTAWKCETYSQLFDELYTNNMNRKRARRLPAHDLPAFASKFSKRPVPRGIKILRKTTIRPWLFVPWFLWTMFLIFFFSLFLGSLLPLDKIWELLPLVVGFVCGIAVAIGPFFFNVVKMRRLYNIDKNLLYADFSADLTPRIKKYNSLRSKPLSAKFEEAARVLASTILRFQGRTPLVKSNDLYWATPEIAKPRPYSDPTNAFDPMFIDRVVVKRVIPALHEIFKTSDIQFAPDVLAQEAKTPKQVVLWTLNISLRRE